jgi:aerobic-type carbon monoxide dehydrogenase small subunit (CoxS/CutS family)
MDKKPTLKAPGGVSRRDFMKGIGSGALGTAVLAPLRAQTIATKKGRVPVYERKTISLTVNGKKLDLAVEANETLLDALRDKLDLTGAKKVCDRGECGGCTVLLDGAPVYACMTLAVRADGKTVRTVEGLAKNGKLHPVQEAFIEKDGYQCGFCTPGFIMATSAFLEKNPAPSLDEIKQGLSGNLCRCGNYAKIYQAVDAAAKKMKGV